MREGEGKGRGRDGGVCAGVRDGSVEALVDGIGGPAGLCL
jgi:hypothetical protein